MLSPSDISIQDRLPDGRQRDRVEVLIETGGRFCADVEAKVFLHNISASGVLIETTMALQMGQSIHLNLPEAGPTEFSVVWGDQNFFGCRATVGLSRAVLSAAKLRNLMPAPAIATPVAPPAPVDELADTGLARRLRQLRESKGFSLAALSRESGISKPSIWAWETGKTMPRPRSINALAAALGVNPSTIWGRDGREMSPSSLANSPENVLMVEEVVAEARNAIAAATGVKPHQVKISIEY